MKPACLLALCLLLPAFGDPPVLPDGSLHDLWFKVAVKTKGKAVSHDGSEVSKVSITTHNFVHLTLTVPIADGEVPGTEYGVEIWNEESPGNWASTDVGTNAVVVTSEDDYILPDLGFSSLDAEHELNLRATLLAHVKRDKNGDVTSAKLSTLGCEVWHGSSAGHLVYGGAKLTGKTVDVDELPFEP